MPIKTIKILHVCSKGQHSYIYTNKYRMLSYCKAHILTSPLCKVKSKMAEVSYATYDIVSQAEDNNVYQETADSMYNQLQRSDEMKRHAAKEPSSAYSTTAKENASCNVNGEKQMRASVAISRDEPKSLPPFLQL